MAEPGTVAGVVSAIWGFLKGLGGSFDWRAAAKQGARKAMDYASTVGTKVKTAGTWLGNAGTAAYDYVADNWRDWAGTAGNIFLGTRGNDGTRSGGLLGVLNSTGNLLGLSGMSQNNPQQLTQAQGGGLFGQIDNYYGNMVKQAERVRKLYEIKNEISRMADPVGYSKKQGRANLAYMDASYPGTNIYERLGTAPLSPGVASAGISSAAARYGAETSAAPAHRMAGVAERKVDKELQKLSGETAKLWQEIKAQAIANSQGIENLKYKKTVALINSAPSGFWQGLHAAVKGSSLKEFDEMIQKLFKAENNEAIVDAEEEIRDYMSRVYTNYGN
jgi:hypothetical protein